MNKTGLIKTIIEASLEVMDEDDIIRALIDNYEDHKDISWLLYDLINAGYDYDDLGQYGFDMYDIEEMSFRVMRNDGPE